MGMTFRFFGCAVALLCCGLGPVWIFPGPLFAPNPTPDIAVIDSLPIRRVALDAEQLSQEMERVQKGLLVQLPRADFEDRVRKAAQAQATQRQPARLIEGFYRARLEGSALLGTGQWKVIHPGPAPAILPLEPLNLFLRQPRFENHEALVADLTGKGPGLLLDQVGPRTVTFDWTARGDFSPDGLHFDLKTPACALASLELTLPADRRLTVSPDTCLLSGPFAAEAPAQRIWKVSFAGRSQLHVLIHQAGGPDQPAPLLLATLKAIQEITPDLLQAEYQFDLQAPRGGVHELRCECDSTLRPYEVSLPGLETWELHATGQGASDTLVIKLREALQGSSLLRVRCLAPIADGPGHPSASNRSGLHPISWRSPGMRLIQAIPRGETLVLRLHPDVRFDEWQPNGFRLAEASVDATGWHVLTLDGGGILEDERDKGTPSRFGSLGARPSARLQASGADYRARVVSWWQVGPGQDSVAALISYEVLQGHLFQLPLLLPAGWGAERVEMAPPALLRNWNVTTKQGRSLLTVDLQQSLTPPNPTPFIGSAVAPPRLTLRLRPLAKQDHISDRASSSREWLQPFPDIVPQGARWSEGSLAIEYDERAYEAIVRSPLVPASLEEEGPWGKQVPDHYYSYRDQPLTGTLLLLPRPLHLRGRSVQNVFPNGDRVVVTTQVYLQPDAGIPDTLDFVASAPLGVNWSWKTESGGSAARAFVRRTDVEAAAPLGVLGSHTPFGVVGFLVAQPLGERWRLTLTPSSRPSEPISLQFTCEVPRGESERWEVPLLTLHGVDSAEADTILHLPASANVRVQTRGLIETAAGPHSLISPPWRSFRHGLPPLSLALSGPLPEASAPPAPQMRRALLTTQVMPDHLLHTYRFQIENWREPILPLTLPEGARLISVHVDGRAVEVPLTGAPSEVATVSLPGFDPTRAGAVHSSSFHSYEVNYASTRLAGLMWDRLATPRPALPIESDALRRIWRLPPGWQPLLDGDCVRLPGPSEDGSRLDPKLQQLHGQFASFSSFADWEDRQRQSLSEATAVLIASQTGKTMPLGEAMERLSIDLLRDHQVPLVLHAQALREAGLGPDSPMRWAPPAQGQAAPPPWESLGLICIPCRPAILMTTRRQWETWQTGVRGKPGTLDANVESAVAEAVALGRDGSNRFRSVADWLRGERLRPAGTATSSNESGQPSGLTDLRASDLPPGWTEWEPVAGKNSDTNLVVVRRDIVSLAGLTLAAALAGLFGLAWSSLGHLRLRSLLLWLAASGLAVCWLPAALHELAWWPWMTAVAVAACWYVGSALFIPASVGAVVVRGAVRAATAAAVILLAVAGLGVRAAPTSPVESFTVILVRGHPDAPQPDSVLVAPELLDRLETLIQPPGGMPRGAVLLTAKYEAAATEASADFDAVFQAHCFDDQATLALRLAGVLLQEEVLLDGARAYPTALAAPQIGYSLKLEGRGSHSIRLRFRVPVQSNRGNRELQFSVPKLVQSRLAINLPPGSGNAQVPTRMGEQRVATSADGVHIEADLGRVTTPVHVRWRQESGLPRPLSVDLYEAYLWDLRDDASSLKALLRYNVIQGRADSFELDLPDPLEVRSVEARQSAPGKPVPRLKDWQVRGADRQRRLRLEFQNAVTGEVQVVLELVPRQPFGPIATLPLPTPRDVHPVQSYLAYQLDGIEARVNGLAHLTGPRVDDFVEFWKSAGEEEPRRLATAFAVTRKADAMPFLRLQLNTPVVPLSATEDISWRVSRHQADFQMTARLNAPAGKLALVEWSVPSSLNVSHLSGPHVWHWSQSGSRLQVWFHQTISAAELQLAGWLALDEGQKGPADDRPVQFDMPCLRILGAASQTTTLRVVPSTGLTLSRPQLRNLSPSPNSRGANTEYAYVAKDAAYGASFQVNSADQPREARILTTSEFRNNQITFVTTVEWGAAPADGRSFEVRLDDWREDDNVRIEAANVVRQREQRRGPSSREWHLDVEPGAPNPSRVTLTMTRGLEEESDVIPVPRVSVVRAARTDHWFAVHGAGIGPEPSSHLTPITALGPASAEWQKTWPVEAERLRQLGGAAWKVLNNNPLHLTRRSGLTATSPVQVFLVEQSASVADGRTWLHQAAAWLYHRANSDLEIALPEGAGLVSATIDGAPVVPILAESPSIWLHLPEDAGACRVTVRWKFDPADEPLAKPKLTRPRFDGVTEDEQLWTLYIPRGYSATTADPSTSSLPAEQDLRRAEAQMRLSGVLAEQARGGRGLLGAQLLSAQQRFYFSCRLAELQLTAAPGDSANVIWLQTLCERNNELARTQGFEKTRADAERHARAASDAENAASPADDPLPERGTPIYGQAHSGAVPTPPQLQWGGVIRTRHALATSLVLLIVIATICVLTYCSGVLAWVRRFWPEQLALLAALLCWLDGFSVPVVALIFIAIIGRLWELSSRAYRFLQRPAAKADTHPSAVPHPV